MLLLIKSFLPRKLPTGLTAFNAWIADIVAISGLPDNTSTRQTAAMFILHLPPALGYLSIRKISNQLIKAAANQVATEVLRISNEPKSVPEATSPVVQEVKA